MRISDWSSDVCSSDLDPTIEVSGAERRAFEDDRLVRAARALGEIGAWREQSAFLRALAQQASSPADHVLAGQLAKQIGRPALGVMIGRSAQANSLDAAEVSGFPTEIGRASCRERGCTYV